MAAVTAALVGHKYHNFGILHHVKITHNIVSHITAMYMYVDSADK